MRTVYKYPFTNCMELPKKAVILNVDFQGDKLCMWALVDPKQKDGIEERFFLILPTGFVDIPDDMNVKHLKTLLHPSGTVWHVFETNLNSIRGVVVDDGSPVGVTK